MARADAVPLRSPDGDTLPVRFLDGTGVAITSDTDVPALDVAIGPGGRGDGRLPFSVRLEAGGLPRAAGRYSARFAAEDGRVTYGEPGMARCDQQDQRLVGVTSFSVSATIDALCTVDAARLDFGSIVSLATPADAVTTLMVRCTRGTPFEIALEGGNGGGRDPARRRLISGPNTLTYAIFTDPGRRSPWGSTRDADTVRGIGTGITQQIFVYGRIYAQFIPAARQYADSLLVSVRY